jgi:hypothetical protein
MSTHTFVAKIVFTTMFLIVPLCAQYPQMEFPMHPSDWWQYSEGPGIFDESRVLRDTVMPNGMKYSIFSGVLPNGYYRKDGPRLYRLAGSNEWLICDFSAKAGDTLAYYRGYADTVMVVAREQGLWQCFDRLRFQMRFLHVSKNSPGIIRAGYQVADSVGFVVISQETVFLVLAGAVINGRPIGVITSVAESPSAMASDVTLLQNYPNPFNGMTQISVAVTYESDVSLRIYDLLGREIALLISQHLQRGTYTIRWDASTHSSGVYLCRLVAGSTVKTTLMLLTK